MKNRQQPDLIINFKIFTMLMNSTREPFDAVVVVRKIDLRSYRIRGQGRCPPLMSFLIVGTCIGLFAYVNTYFIIKIANLIDGSIYSKQTQTFSCNSYYCDQTAYNFINYYSNYIKCNTQNCGNIICGGYNCSNSVYQMDLNYYYACQATVCGPLNSNSPVPPIVQAAYIISIVAACLFGLGVLIGILYGLLAALCSNSLTVFQRIAVFITFVWPKLKYYAFRRRQNWEDFYFDFRGMVIVDMIINFCYAGTLALYIYLQVNQMWQTPPQVAGFYILIWATITRASMVGEVAGPFFAANRELNQMRSNVNVII